MEGGAKQLRGRDRWLLPTKWCILGQSRMSKLVTGGQVSALPYNGTLHMRTLFLNPPSFEGFDGGASSRWPASREIESYWYPVWLCYPAGMLPDSKVVDAPPHKISIEQTVEMAKDFELLVLFTSTPGLRCGCARSRR